MRFKSDDNLKSAGPVKQQVSNDVENSANPFGKQSTEVTVEKITENPSSKTTVPSTPAVIPGSKPHFNSTVQESDPFKVIITSPFSFRLLFFRSQKKMC